MSKAVYQDGLDIYFNAILSGSPAGMPACIATLKGMGITDRQIAQMRSVAIAKGLPVPAEKQTLKEVTFKWRPVIDSLEDKNKFQDVADQYLEFIYGFKFNDGIHGAFGTAHPIKTSSYGHEITLILPKIFEVPLESDEWETWRTRTDATRRLKSSVEHYRNSGKGCIVLKYE